MPVQRRPNLAVEALMRHQGYHLLAGVDEVGRGCLAGPLVAAAVILPLERPDLAFALQDVRDSKQMSHRERTHAFARVREIAVAVGLGWATRRHIDEVGISGANRLAMLRAVRALRPQPHALLTDFVTLPEVDLPQLALTKGDSRSLSIAAASVVAKVVRDRWMTTADRRYPEYGFCRHKGYGTAEHRRALHLHGPCALHRRSFAPVAEQL